MAQQLWVSLVSHKNSNEFLPLVEQFLDQHLERVSDFMKWKDYSGRSAEATATLLCKRAMTSRSYFMGLYDIPTSLRHEYKSASCTVYIVDRVEDDKRTRVALKFMKHADEFERETYFRETMIASGSGQERISHDFVVGTPRSFHYSDAAFQAAVRKHNWIISFENPCLIVMPASDFWSHEEKLFLSYRNCLLDLHRVTDDQAEGVDLEQPIAAEVRNRDNGAVQKTFLLSNQEDCEFIAGLTNLLLNSSGDTVAPAAIDIVRVLMGQGQEQ